MATFTLDTDSLASILSRIGPPAFASADCVVAPPHLSITLRRVQSGMRILGKAVGHFDVTLLIKAQMQGASAVRIDCELGQVSGVPMALARMVAKGGMVQGKLQGLIDRIGIAKAVDLDPDNGGALVRLDQLPWLGSGLLRQLVCERLDIPGGKTHALSAHLRVAPAAAPGAANERPASRPARQRH